MQWEIHLDSVELRQPPFRKRPEGFNPVDVHTVALGKLVLPVVHAKMPIVTDGHQTVVPPPAIGVDHRLRGDLAENHILKRSLLTVRNNLREDFAVALEDAEDRLLQGAPAPLEPAVKSSSASGSAVGLVALGLTDELAFLLDSMSVDGDPKPPKVMIDRLAIHSDQPSSSSGIDVDTETPQNLFYNVSADLPLWKHSSRLLTSQVMV